jgi:hypothetical protein
MMAELPLTTVEITKITSPIIVGPKHDPEKVKLPQIPVGECAFHVIAQEKIVDGVCSDDFTIDKIKEFLIKNTDAQPDKLDKLDKSDKEEVIEVAKETLGCSSESCIIERDEFKDFIGFSNFQKARQRFKEHGPANSNKWLNNSNIDNTINQWRKMFPSFLHVPFQMSDFDTEGTELNDIDLATEFNGKYESMGVVLNTDISSGNGIHWFCIFADARNKKHITIEVFDSAGNIPPGSVIRWVAKQRLALAKAFPESKVEDIVVTRQNKLQYSNSECGVFSLWYIFCRLNQVPHSYFTKPGSVTDDMMLQFRKYLFRS